MCDFPQARTVIVNPNYSGRRPAIQPQQSDGITEIVFSRHTRPLVARMWMTTLPACLTHLHLPDEFSGSLAHLPPSLTHLTVGVEFNEPLDSLPPSLVFLHVRSMLFDHPIDRLPSTLEYLYMRDAISFDQPLDQLPAGLCELSLGCGFTRRLPARGLAHLRRLEMLSCCGIDGRVLPEVATLVLAMLPVESIVHFPARLETLVIRTHNESSAPLRFDRLPPTLTCLHTRQRVDPRPLAGWAYPISVPPALIHAHFGFPLHPEARLLLPNTLKSLHIQVCGPIAFPLPDGMTACVIVRAPAMLGARGERGGGGAAGERRESDELEAPEAEGPPDTSDDSEQQLHSPFLWARASKRLHWDALLRLFDRGEYDPFTYHVHDHVDANPGLFLGDTRGASVSTFMLDEQEIPSRAACRGYPYAYY
jgi:hypothetical protein